MENILRKSFRGLESFENYLDKMGELIEEIEVDVYDYTDYSWTRLIGKVIEECFLDSKLLHIDNLFLKLYEDEKSFIEYGLSLKKGDIVKIEDIFHDERIIKINSQNKPKNYIVPVVWQEAGNMRIKADCYEEAIHIAINEAELPKDADYLSDSLVIDEDSVFYGVEE